MLRVVNEVLISFKPLKLKLRLKGGMVSTGKFKAENYSTDNVLRPSQLVPRRSISTRRHSSQPTGKGRRRPASVKSSHSFSSIQNGVRIS